MKFRKPIVQLLKKTNLGAPSNFYLHVTTYFPKAYIVADGHRELVKELNDKREMKIVLKIKEDVNIPDIQLINPVVHFVDLGTLPFEDNGNWFVKVLITKKGDRNGDSDGNGTVLPDSDAQEIERPIGD